MYGCDVIIYTWLELIFIIPLYMCTMIKHEQTLQHNFDILEVGIPDLTQNHTVIIAVKQKNLEYLETILIDVSNSASINYGKYLTREEVVAITADWSATEGVEIFLRSKGVDFSTSIYGEYITITSQLYKLEEIFSTKFFEFNFAQNRVDRTFVRAYEYSLDDSIVNFVNGVFNIIDIPMKMMRKKVVVSGGESKSQTYVHNTKSASRALSSIYAGYIYPGLLKSFYHIPSYFGSAQSSQLVYATVGQSMSPADLSSFQSTFSLPQFSIHDYEGGYNDTACLVELSNCQEANLDVQYIMATSGNVPTTFW